MIEKMKFVSISGPKNDLDRMVNQYLSHYEIQLENALTELRSASKLEPYPGTNPYREPLQKAQKLLASCPGAKQQEISTGTMPVENAITLVNDMDTELAASDEERESLKAKEKEVSSLLEQVRLYVELDFDIPAILKLKHIKYRFGRIRKESFPQLQAFADRSDETILFKCHESDHYISLLYFTPDIASDRIDTVFSSLQFERIYLPDEYAGTPKTEVERLENELANLKANEQALDAKDSEYLLTRQTSLQDASQVLKSYEANFNVRKYAACTHDKNHPFYILCGWMTKEDAEALHRDLAKDADTFFVLEDSKEHVTSIPPTKLKNIPLLRPFEMFVKMYGLPSYDEFDPTLLIAITYSIFFGFMFGDAGQGLVLLIGGFLLYKFKKIDLAAIISCCGFFSTIFGCLFGSVFGFEDVIPALWLKPTEAMTDLPFVGRLNTVFVVAIALGMGVILFTMILNMITSFKNHDTEKTWFDTNGLAGFVFYFSLAATIVMFMSGHTLPAAAILIIMFVLPLLVMFFKEPLTAALEKKSEKISGGVGMFITQGFFELFEVLLSYFSNTLSFVRVGAFAVSHAAMMQVVLMLAGAETGAPSIPVIVLGNLFVCGMEGLIVGIQVLRLEYYELFSRFYKGSGREFKPFYEK
ncbi:MAG: V-type ATPase 116kDa subunit family protein [Candidatus Copromonas sp.]|nr:V-type ATPase 116kDa subunit family protein [Candidatus Copromonas sp.]